LFIDMQNYFVGFEYPPTVTVTAVNPPNLQYSLGENQILLGFSLVFNGFSHC
jgi:hypothetical protein